MDFYKRLCDMTNYGLFQELRLSYNEWGKEKWEYRIDCNGMKVDIDSDYKVAISNCFNKLDQTLLSKERYYKENLTIDMKDKFNSLMNDIKIKLIDQNKTDVVFTLTYGGYEDVDRFSFKAEFYNEENVESRRVYHENPIIALTNLINNISIK